MQDIFIEILPIIIFAIGVGTISSMIGIGGGIINTPLLIIVFFLSEQSAPATALVAALSVGAASTVAYARQKPRPIVPKAGLFVAITTIPGSLTGVFLRTLITDQMLLRYIFAILLFPIALKMLFAKKKGPVDRTAQLEAINFGQIGSRKLMFALFGGFCGGIVAGLLGLGGGVIVVPVLSLIMGLPMHAAVATSMFTMIFTASAGTAMNYAQGFIDPFFALALGIGMIIGAQIGPRLACKVNAVQLKQIFGLVLVFPLVKMAKLGMTLFNEPNAYTPLSVAGDALIWLIIIIPIALIKYYLRGRIVAETPDEETCDAPTGI
ncbi:MAG: putative membrane transporter protein [Candidatus Thorarchaeota archaeon]|nr:MAG: putative membrane transporter protein [Candidatus Thorarchaeota archaeon]